MIERNDLFLIESPITMIEGETIKYSVEWLGATKLENPALAIYLNGKDISNKVLLGFDDFEIAGSVVTLKKITTGQNDGGLEYVVLIQCTVDKNIERRKLMIEVVESNK